MLLLTVLACQLVFGQFLSRGYFIARNERKIQELFTDIRKGYSDDPEVMSELTRRAENVYNINVLIVTGEHKIVYANRQSDGSFFFNEPALHFPEGQQGQGSVPDDEAQKDIPTGAFGSAVDDFSETPSVKKINSEKDKKDGAKYDEMLLLLGKFSYDGSERYVSLWSSVESIDSSIQMFTGISAVIACAVLIIGLLIAYFVAKSMTRPIKNIENVSKKIAELDFEERADENVRTPELLSLAQSVNSMSEHLQLTIDNLKLANSKLSADIDNQKRIEKMRREFIANVSHEMKTPLCLLQMYSENLKNNIDGIDKDYYCQTIVEETARLDEMVKSMLDISSIENGLSALKFDEINLSELCKYTISKMSIMFEAMNFSYEIADNITVLGDDHYLEQAIKNYLTNAASYTENGKKINVTLKADDGNAVFTVFNEGSRIDEEKLPYIWDSFYKTDEARVRKDSVHAGLGLYIVKTVIDKLGGSCNVKNEDDGVSFSFSLPIKPDSGDEPSV